MRIVHVITGLGVGGAETMLLKLLSAMDPLAFEPMVVSLVPPGPTGEQISALGVRVETLKMRRGLQAPGAVLRLARLLREFKPDLVQTWMYHADLLGALAVPLAGRPILIWNIRQSDMDPRLSRRATRMVARVAALVSNLAPDHIVCCSERARTVHRTLGYRDDIISVIPNGFDLNRFRPNPIARAELRTQQGIPTNTPLVGVVARFDPQKDIRTFLQAAVLVRASRPDCRFLLCGLGMDASNTQLRDWIGDAGLADAVHLLGPRRDTPRVFAALDILVSSSAYGEGFPNVIGEAMACGVPCAVTDVGDSLMIVADTGLSAPPREPYSLAAVICRLLDEGPCGLTERGLAARARIAAQYDLPLIAARYAQLYRALHAVKT